MMMSEPTLILCFFFPSFFGVWFQAMTKKVCLLHFYMALKSHDFQFLLFKKIARSSATSISSTRFSGLQQPVTGSGIHETFSVDPTISSPCFFTILDPELPLLATLEATPCEAAAYPRLYQTQTSKININIFNQWISTVHIYTCAPKVKYAK